MRQYKMKTKVNEIYIYRRGQSAPAREFTRGRDWRERYFSVLFTIWMVRVLTPAKS